MRTKSSLALKILPACVALYATVVTTVVTAESPTQTSTSAAPEVLASLSAKLALHPKLAAKVLGIHNGPATSLVKAKRAEPLDACTSSTNHTPTQAHHEVQASSAAQTIRPAFSVRTWLSTAAAWFSTAHKETAVKKAEIGRAHV